MYRRLRADPVYRSQYEVSGADSARVVDRSRLLAACYTMRTPGPDCTARELQRFEARGMLALALLLDLRADLPRVRGAVRGSCIGPSDAWGPAVRSGWICKR